MAFFIVVIIALIAVKAIWVSCSINGIGSFETEKKDIIRRANYLTSKVATTPQKLLEEMPSDGEERHHSTSELPHLKGCHYTPKAVGRDAKWYWGAIPRRMGYLFMLDDMCGFGQHSNPIS